jgi:hypothetical protein
VGNPNRPNPAPEKQRARILTRPAKEYAYRAIQDGFLRLDPGPITGDDIPVEFPSSFEEQARRERQGMRAVSRRQQWIAGLAAAPGFRPVCAWLRGMAVGRAD